MADLLAGLPTFFHGDDNFMHEVTPQWSAKHGAPGPWLRGSDVRGALRHPETVERLAKHMAGLDPDEEWPSGAHEDLPGYEPSYSHLTGFDEPPTVAEFYTDQAEHVLRFFTGGDDG